jgi:hypothetical protein
MTDYQTAKRDQAARDCARFGHHSRPVLTPDLRAACRWCGATLRQLRGHPGRLDGAASPARFPRRPVRV